VCCGDQIYVEYVSKPQQVDENIGDLFLDTLPGARVVRQSRRFLRREPLKEFCQFTHFACKRHHQVLRSMELPPISLAGELVKQSLQPSKTVHVCH
jgi:hypothetical protein